MFGISRQLCHDIVHFSLYEDTLSFCEGNWWWGWFEYFAYFTVLCSSEHSIMDYMLREIMDADRYTAYFAYLRVCSII